MHDWACVSAGTFHDFHSAWITHLKEALNGGLLPPSFYALAEQRSGRIAPDVLALHVDDDQRADDGWSSPPDAGGGMVAVAEAPPQVRIARELSTDIRFYAAKRRTLVIRHTSGDRVVALIEIVSPANKHSPNHIDKFVAKVAAALEEGVHVLLIDPFPPGRYDPQGMHGAVCAVLDDEFYEPPADSPLTLAAYWAKSPIAAYVEPTRAGVPLIDMPLFLTARHYVPVPLEATYQQAWAGVPERWRRVIEEAENQEERT